MSEFLQDLLKKVKKSADELDAPFDEPDSENDGSAFGSKRKKSAKPGLPTKPGLLTPVEGEPGLPSEPGLVGESGLSTHIWFNWLNLVYRLNLVYSPLSKVNLVYQVNLV